MAFKNMNSPNFVEFNSATSSEFLDMYDSYVEHKLEVGAERIPSKTFAASSFRCDRWSWFRLRGSKPDVGVVDKGLNFTADIGTACHRIIQTNLIDMLGPNWITVKDHIASINFPYEYTLAESGDGLETLIEIKNPPIRFACDGIIQLDGKRYLLEIKTSEYSSWNDLTEPKPRHIDQVKCYSTLLNLPNVIFLYQDRQYGGLKCFEIKIKSYEMSDVRKRFDRVLDLASKNLAPQPLPKGDSWCTPSMCPYYRLCDEYGR